MPMDLLFDGIAVAVSVAAAAIDVARQRIPNMLTYPAIVGAIAARGLLQGGAGLKAALLGGLVGGGLFLVFFLLRTMGAGDVKLMTAIGCLTGPAKSLQIVLATAIAGGILALIYSIWRRRLRTTLANVGDLLRFHVLLRGTVHPNLNLSNAEAVRMPYAVPIAVGVAYTIWTGLH